MDKKYSVQEVAKLMMETETENENSDASDLEEFCDSTSESGSSSVFSESCDSDEDDGGGCGWMEEVDQECSTVQQSSPPGMLLHLCNNNASNSNNIGENCALPCVKLC